MGGGGGSSDTQVFQPPIRQDTPLQQGLIGLATNQLNYMTPYMSYGGGYQLMPQTPFGQVYMPGPNQTIFGNPYNPQNSVGSFGQPAQAPTNFGFQAPQMGGYNPYQAYAGGLMPQSGTSGSNPWSIFGQIPPGMGGAPGQGALPPGNYPYLPGTGPQNPPPQAPPAQQQAPPAANNGANGAPEVAPPQWNTSTIGGDPYHIAAGNAPVGPDGQPQTLEQMQALEAQMAAYHIAAGNPTPLPGTTGGK